MHTDPRRFWRKGRPVMVRKFVLRGFGFNSKPREVWKKAKFERWDGDYAIVIWPNGMLEKLESSEDIR